jgi:hypothetical protein
MKKLILPIFLGSFLLLIISSCSKKKDSAESFSPLSVEENKAVIENTGIDLVQVMDRMKDLQSADAIAELADITSSSGAKGIQLFSTSKLFSMLRSINRKSNETAKINGVFNAIIACKGEDPESVQQFWDENVGTYTWNPGLNDWDIVLGGDKFIIEFPSTETAASNDATLTISDYTGVNISNPVDEDYTGDLPAAVNMDLKVGSETILTFVFGADYNSDGVPNAIAADLIIEGFKFEIDVTNSTEIVSVAYKFLEGSDVIMNLTATGKGLFNEENYENNTITHTETYTYVSDYIWNPNTQQYEPVYATYTDEWEETDFEEILNSADVKFQLLNIELRGEIDIKNLVDNLKLIDQELADDNIDDETADNSYAAKINEYLNLRLVNVESNTIMAKAQAYVVNESDEYGSYTYISFRLIFNDDSPIDMETYFDNGFGSFVSELNNLIYDLNSKYEWDLVPVDY